MRHATACPAVWEGTDQHYGDLNILDATVKLNVRREPKKGELGVPVDQVKGQDSSPFFTSGTRGTPGGGAIGFVTHSKWHQTKLGTAELNRAHNDGCI